MIKNVGKIHAAATYFAFVSRDITAIAKAFGVDTRTIRRWAKDEEWEIALQQCELHRRTFLRDATLSRHRARRWRHL